MSERSLREQIARIIDPWALNQCEWASGQDNDEVLREYLPKRDAAFAKADAILTLLDAARAEGGAGEDQGSSGAESAMQGTTALHPDAPSQAGWRPISSAPRDGTHILALQANTSFGWFGSQKAPEVQTVVHWWGNPGEEGFYTSVNEQEPQQPFAADYWKPLGGLTRDPMTPCGRCGAPHIEHDLEPVGFTCPDREGVFASEGAASQEGRQ